MKEEEEEVCIRERRRRRGSDDDDPWDDCNNCKECEKHFLNEGRAISYLKNLGYKVFKPRTEYDEV